MEMTKRKRNRLKNYDYSRNGAYFITICVKDKRCLLWQNVGERPLETYHLSKYGQVVDIAIRKISLIYANARVDKYVIMPNHIHMIIVLCENERRALRAPTISNIINQMKGYVTKQIGFSLWQKLFYDHIIKNKQEYQKVWQYIDQNPSKWLEDCYFVK